MKKPKNNEGANNYLDLVPKRISEISFHTDANNLVVLEVENKGLFNKMAQAVLHKPKTSNIHMDKFGTFVWRQIEGTRTVLDIANLVHSEFGEEAEPLYPRLIKFMQIMKSYSFIELMQHVSAKKD